MNPDDPAFQYLNSQGGTPSVPSVPSFAPVATPSAPSGPSAAPGIPTIDPAALQYLNQSPDFDTINVTPAGTPSSFTDTFSKSLDAAVGGPQSALNQNAGEAMGNDVLGFGSTAAAPGRAIAAYGQENTAQDLDKARGNLAQSNLELIRSLPSLTDPVRKAALEAQIQHNMDQMQSMNDQARGLQKGEVTLPEIIGSAMKAGTNTLAFGGALNPVGGLLNRLLTYGTTGAALGAGQDLSQGGSDPTKVATSAIMTGLLGGILGTATQYTTEQAPKLLSMGADKLYKLGTGLLGKANSATTNDAIQQLIDDGTMGSIGHIAGQVQKGIQDTSASIGTKLATYDASPDAETINSTDVMNGAIGRLKTATKGLYSDQALQDAVLAVPGASLWHPSVTAAQDLGDENLTRMAQKAVDMSGKSPEITTSAANQLRSGLDDQLSNYYRALKSGAGDVASLPLTTKATKAVADELRNQVQDLSGTASDFKQLSNYRKASSLFNKAPSKIANVIRFAVPAILGGASGFSQGGIPGAIAGVTGGLVEAPFNTSAAVGVDRLGALAGKLPASVANYGLMQGLAHLAGGWDNTNSTQPSP